jgi:hypothetical protein
MEYIKNQEFASLATFLNLSVFDFVAACMRTVQLSAFVAHGEGKCRG